MSSIEMLFATVTEMSHHLVGQKSWAEELASLADLQAVGAVGQDEFRRRKETALQQPQQGPALEQQLEEELGRMLSDVKNGDFAGE
mmetsp:Transcript_25815/g.55934  ORF Transcript_25815/g.55934 Transcript_25815/m.55934 type:complete len:86 (+) Transcript_25815:781-1038(+)